MSLDAVIDTMRAHVAALSGLKRVYDDPPESLSEFPCAMVYAARGTMEANAAGGRSFHTLYIDVYESRTVLPEAMDRAKVWPDRMYQRLKAATDLHIVWPMSYRAAPIEYNSVTHYGVRFEVQVKVNET